MTRDMLAEFRGNVYISSPYWSIQSTLFIVIKITSIDTVLLRTLGGRSITIYVTIHGLRQCKKVTDYDIKEFVKQLLLGAQP